MWHGAIPSLISIDKVNINMIINLLIDISNHHKEDDLIRNILEPIV
jgi:hypothetical protein